MAASGAYAELRSSLLPGCTLMTMEEVCSSTPQCTLGPLAISLIYLKAWTLDMPGARKQLPVVLWHGMYCRREPY